MKTKSFLMSGIMGVALAGFVLTGCHKNDSTTPTSAADSDYTAAEDDANADNASNDAKNVSDASVQAGNVTDTYAPEHHGIPLFTRHYTVTIDSGATYDTMTINFGATPVLCNDGIYREGELLVYWNKEHRSPLRAYFDSGCTVNMSFRNYARGASQLNMVKVNGLRSWLNNGGMITYDTLDNENWSFTANLVLTYPNNDTATWSSSRVNTLEYISGKWYYEITGTASGTSQSGKTYSLTITSPVYHTAFPWWLGGCPYLEGGTISIVPNNNVNNTMTVTFGPIGACSNEVTITLDNVTYHYYMP